MTPPAHILLATQHADPYPYYAGLRAGPPVVFDEEAGVWVVVGATAVREALSHPALRVRPPGEPVPRALVGTAAGAVFGRLVRMNDGDFHATQRPLLAALMAGWTADVVAAAAETAALGLIDHLTLDDWLSAVPVQAMARLLNVAPSALDATTDAVRAFTRGIAAGASPADVSHAAAAAALLMAQGQRLGLDTMASAHRIALMQQSLDATAGLIGNTVARVHARPDAWHAAFRSAGGIAAFVETVAREDPAIHHTRRWAAQALTLHGADLAEGAGLVILLAGQAPFGAGPHGCPGEHVALALACGALMGLARAGRLDRWPAPTHRWRALPNARIPVFTP